MDFSIIIINYNLSKEVKNCINSLFKIIDEPNYEIILVDNHSDDESIIKIAEELSSIAKLKLVFIRNEKNIGFGNACNLAAKQAAGKVLFFLNPDTIVEGNIFQKTELNKKFEVNYQGILGLNVNNRKLMDFSAGLFPNYLLETLNILSLGRYCEAIYIGFKAFISGKKRLKVDWVMGSSLFIRKDLFEQVNGFDPDYFLYFEEMDLCKRIIQKGLSVNYLPKIKIRHLESLSSKRNYYFFTKMFYKGKLLFLKKHSSNLGFSLYKILISLHTINQIIFWWFVQFMNTEKALGKVKAFREILKNLNYPEKISNTP